MPEISCEQSRGHPLRVTLASGLTPFEKPATSCCFRHRNHIKVTWREITVIRSMLGCKWGEQSLFGISEMKDLIKEWMVQKEGGKKKVQLQELDFALFRFTLVTFAWGLFSNSALEGCCRPLSFLPCTGSTDYILAEAPLGFLRNQSVCDSRLRALPIPRPSAATPDGPQ